jgi:hypothetical protein
MGLFPLPTDPEVCAPYLFLSSLYSPGFFQSEIVCRWLKFGQKVLSIINYTDKTMSWFVFFFVSFSKKLNLCGSSCNGISGLTKDSMFQWNRIPSNHLSQNEATEYSRVPREKRVGIFFFFSQLLLLLLYERAMDRATWWQWNIKSDHFRRPRNQTRNASGSWLLYTLS